MAKGSSHCPRVISLSSVYLVWLGLERRGQSKGLRAAHTICVKSQRMGFWPQRTEDEESFRKAISDLVPGACRRQVKYLISESAVKLVRKFPLSLVGEAEEPLHLVGRVEFMLLVGKGRIWRENSFSCRENPSTLQVVKQT